MCVLTVFLVIRRWGLEARHAEPWSFYVFGCWSFVRKRGDPLPRPREWLRGRCRLSALEGAERSQPTASAVGTGWSTPAALKGAIQLSFEPSDYRPPRPRLTWLRQESRAESAAGVACIALPGLVVFGVSFPRLKPWAMISGSSGAATGAEPRVALWRGGRSANVEPPGLGMPRPEARPAVPLPCLLRFSLTCPASVWLIQPLS